MREWLAPSFGDTPVSPGRPKFGYAPADKTTPPAVTVVTPYYNTGELFMETAQSVLGQSLQQWEWLIINDASSDPEALAVLERFRGIDPRIRVIDLPKNRGLPGVRNEGLRQAKAGLVFLLDSDDLIEPTTLEKTAWCLESYPEFSFCKGLTVDFGAHEGLFYAGFEVGRLFLQRNIITIRCMLRRDVALSVGGFDESLVTGLEDWEFWVRSAANGFWGRTIHEFLDWYRRRESHSDRWAAWTPAGLDRMRRELRRRYPRLYAGAFPPTEALPLQPFPPIRDELPFTNVFEKKAKRILLVIPWMAMGGADKFNLDLIRQIIDRGYDVSIATTLPDNYPWYREFARLTPDIFILPNFLRLNDYPRFLRYLIQSRQCDSVLVSNSEVGYRLLPYLRSRCPETATLDFSHLEEDYWSYGGYPGLAVAHQDELDLNVVTSHHLKEWMVQKGADPAQIEVCYINVDTARLAPDGDLRKEVRGKLGVPPERCVILFAGRLCAQKQPQVLAQVMHELRARGSDFLCLVAGDGEERRSLEATLRRLRLRSHVKLLGAVHPDRMRELLAASDMFFLPSKMEGIALTLYEAMSMGVVPVGAAVGGQPELVTPDCGVLIQRGDGAQEVSAYADALERLLRSPELRESLGKAARERICAQFPIERMGERMQALIEQAQEKALRARGEGRGARSTRPATQHTALAVEYLRLYQEMGTLRKYQRLEGALGRARRLAEVPKLALYRLSRLARPILWVKDALWIVGHRVKKRLLHAPEDVQWG